MGVSKGRVGKASVRMSIRRESVAVSALPRRLDEVLRIGQQQQQQQQQQHTGKSLTVRCNDGCCVAAYCSVARVSSIEIAAVSLCGVYLRCLSLTEWCLRVAFCECACVRVCASLTAEQTGRQAAVERVLGRRRRCRRAMLRTTRSCGSWLRRLQRSDGQWRIVTSCCV